MMRIKIMVFLMILIGTAILAGNAKASGAERDCPMPEARHITSVRVTVTGFGDRDQYGKPMQVNGTWDLPLTRYYPNSACDWSTKTPSGHTISLTVLDARHPQGGAFLLTIAASTGGVQAEGSKPLSADPYGSWRMKPIAGVTAGTAQVSDSPGGKQERSAAPSLYVAADVAKLRADPSGESESFMRLRINSPLEVLETRTPWLKVSSAGGVTGWIREDLTRNQPLTVEEAWNHAGASSGAELLSWLERTVALDPAHKAAWTALREAYAAAGKKDRAKAIERVLAGRDRFFMAECRNGMAELRVAYGSGGSFTKLGMERDGSLMRDELNAFADEVTAWPWYAITGTSAKLLPGTPFPQPVVDREAQTVRLGTCPDELNEEQVMTTAPFVPVQLKARKGGLYMFPDGSGVKLQIRAEKKGESWTVIGRDEKPLRQRDGTAATWRSTEDPPCPAGTFAPGTWYRNRLSGVIYGTMNFGWSCCIGGGDGECGSESGEWLTIIFPAEGIVESVYNFIGGC